MHCALFQEFVEIIFKFSADLDVRNESTVKSGICDYLVVLQEYFVN